MKKNFILAAAILGMGVSASVIAAPAAIPADGKIGVEGGAGATCDLLRESVQINLSQKVNGSYNCIEPDNTIKIATCHENGSRSETRPTCSNIGTVATPVYPPGCTGENTPPEGGTPFTDYRGYSASSQGGKIVQQALGGACETGQLNALIPD